VFGSAEAKILVNQLKITTKYKVEEHGIEADQEVNKLLFQSLKQHFADLTYDKFINAYPVRYTVLYKHQKWDLL
jgi:SecD/SecF fusion protein